MMKKRDKIAEGTVPGGMRRVAKLKPAKDYYAHSVDGKPVEQWHRLEKHLLGTAKLASQFAEVFGCGEWGYVAGLWHDLGKYSEDFQKKILVSADAHIETKKTKDVTVNHSTAGAIHAIEKFKIPGKISNPGRIFSYLID